MKLGTFRKQPQDFEAFIPDPFPPKSGFQFSPQTIYKANLATRKLGKLDGITQLLPDVDFFLLMYIRKDATSSSQIEGTQATMIDAIEAESKISKQLPDDVNDILHYIHALNYGINRLKDLPFSLRLIKEIHKELMKDARANPHSSPGTFRSSQNWISGSSPANAYFVPPPVHEMKNALSDLEKFFYKKDNILPIIKAGLLHAQFETIHPFVDGNGRTGRMLITLFLQLENLLELPVLFLSSYFKKHQKLYYKKLNNYHNEGVEDWINFFIIGVIETAENAIETVQKIIKLRENDMKKIQVLSKTASTSAIKILPKLFQMPIVNVETIQKWTNFSRQGAQNVINRFVELDILNQKDKTEQYGRSFIYHRYLKIFK